MSSDSLALLIKACNFAAERHRNQRRKDVAKTPYINHPIVVTTSNRLSGVANILTDEAQVTDTATIAAALLHDTVEDTETSFAEIENLFGTEICSIVKECTDDKSLPQSQRKLLQIRNAASHSFEAKLVHLADKLYNVRDLERSPPVGWDAKRITEYFEWTRRVVEQLSGTNAKLEHSLAVILDRNIPNDVIG